MALRALDCTPFPARRQSTTTTTGSSRACPSGQQHTDSRRALFVMDSPTSLLTAVAATYGAQSWPWLFYNPALYLPTGGGPLSPLGTIEQPLDLSAKFSIPSSFVPRSSVIQSTRQVLKEDLPSGPYLPTCQNPEITIIDPDGLTPATSSTPETPAAQITDELPSASSSNRMSYPREFKLMVIDYYYSNGLNKYRTCKEFQITKSMLNGWLTKADKIRQSRPGALKSGRSGRKPQFPQIEQQLFTLYQEKASGGEKVSNRWLRETARSLALEQCSSSELSGMCQFSERWLANFKRRYDLVPTTKIKSSECGSASTTSFDSDEEAASTCSSMSSQMARAVLHQGNQLPIHVFYEKFPWLCRRGPSVDGDNAELTRSRKIQYPDLEKRLIPVIAEEKTERVSNRWLQEKAREVALEMAREQTADDDSPVVLPAFSEHWLHNFKKRYGILSKSLGSSASQKE